MLRHTFSSLCILWLVGCAHFDSDMPVTAESVLSESQRESQREFQRKSAKEQASESTLFIERALSQSTAWWKAYQDPTLEKLIDYALTHNGDLAKSVLTIQKAMAQANLKETEIYPTLSGSINASSNRDLYQSDSFNQNRNFAGELSLNYELDLWQKIHNEKDAAYFEYEATKLDQENIRLALIHSVIDLYFNLVYLSSAIDAVESSLVNDQRIAKLTMDKFQSGKVGQLELLEITRAIKERENSLLTYKNERADNEQLLKNLLNVGSLEHFDLEYRKIHNVPLAKIDLDIPISILAQRPDLEAQELRLKSAVKSYTAMNKSWYPSITLQSVLNSNHQSAGNMLSYPTLLGAISINLPFLNWNEVKNNIKISKADYEMAYLELEDKVNTAINEVAYYHHASFVSHEAVKNSQKRYQDNLQISKIYQARYQAGSGELSTLLENQNSTYSAEIGLMSDLYQRIKYDNMLLKALGSREAD